MYFYKLSHNICGCIKIVHHPERLLTWLLQEKSLDSSPKTFTCSDNYSGSLLIRTPVIRTPANMNSKSDCSIRVFKLGSVYNQWDH